MPRRLLALLSAAPLLGAPGDGTAPASPSSAPAYDASGALLRPKGYRRWVFVGASLGLGYSEDGHQDGPGDFHHVYLRPESYEAFRRTGRFPDQTVLVLELHRAAQKVAPGRRGLFEGPRIALEAAVKDAERFPEGWAYFSFGDGSAAAAKPFRRADCFDCHRRHAALDNVFVQFYPVLRDPAVD